MSVLGVPMLIASAASFAVQGVDFDGTNDYLTRGAPLNDATDSPDGWLSVWLRLDGGDGAVLTLLDHPDSGSNAFLIRNASNKFSMSFINTGGSATFGMTSSAARTAGAAWLHLAMSWQWRASLVQQIYVNGVSDFGTDDKNAATGTIDYTYSDTFVGEKNGTAPASGVKFNGCMAEFIYAPGQTLDLSVAANMAKLRNEFGKPVDPGYNGASVTGTAPLVYLSCRAGELASDFAKNRGSGGQFFVTGSLDIASTSPSD